MFSPSRTTRTTLKNLSITAAVVAVSTLVYFVLPFGSFGVAGTWGFVILFLAGLLTVSAVIIWQISHYRSSVVRRDTSLVGVIAALYLSILFFSAVYYSLAMREPLAISALRTRLDALYFTLTITSTTGFGDIRPTSQLARAVVTVNLAFNLGFLGAAVTILRTVGRRGGDGIGPDMALSSG